ncbi:hypothetical protein NPIL_2761 [Nephila pilipes]|uniref:Uncharacterized protein n=1 Tax=Nephila pilipes TaxID=299642 RepID=A0A8X6NYS2_NEPPI|nr:hypothetical protein NPIL_2761 [Nephila pilipes]
MDRERDLLERFATDVVLFITSELSNGPEMRTGLSPAVQVFIKMCLTHIRRSMVQPDSAYFKIDFITEDQHRRLCETYIHELLSSDILENTVSSYLVVFTVLAIIGALCCKRGAEEASYDSIEYMIRYLDVLKSRGHIDENFLRDVQIFCEQFLES